VAFQLLLHRRRLTNGGRNVRVLLKGVHMVRYRLASGVIAIYYYAWRGGPGIDAEPGTPEFVRLYTEAHPRENGRRTGQLWH
jgi:hypothetical protein